MSIGSITGSFSLMESLSETEEEVEQLKTELDLMEVQLEDKKHENVITRIQNAELILNTCEKSHMEKNSIRMELYRATKHATLMKDYDKSEKILTNVVDTLMQCGEESDNTPILNAPYNFDNTESTSQSSPELQREFPITRKTP